MKISRDIQSLTAFKRDTNRLVKQINETKAPLILTVNGKPSVVVQDAESYDELMRLKDRMDLIAGVKRGLESMRKGEGRDAEEFFDELFREFNIPKE
jgi:prevent-host-death family protein